MNILLLISIIATGIYGSCDPDLGYGYGYSCDVPAAPITTVSPNYGGGWAYASDNQLKVSNITVKPITYEVLLDTGPETVTEGVVSYVTSETNETLEDAVYIDRPTMYAVLGMIVIIIIIFILFLILRNKDNDTTEYYE